MNKQDYQYICEHFANISRIPIRLYKDKKPQIYKNPTTFPSDPGAPYIDELLCITKKISYYITNIYHYYGVINFGNYTLLIGPTYQLPPSRSQIHDYMFSLGIHQNYHEQYQLFLASITTMPLETFVHLLCLVNFYLTGEKIAVTDLILYDSSSKINKQDLTIKKKIIAEDFPDFTTSISHNTFEFEKEMMGYISDGNLDSLHHLFSRATAGQTGKLADNFLRQTKNLFITSATLVSRAAIEGGLVPEEVLTLCDRYIQHCERLDNPEQIMNLQYHMVLDYCTQVNELNHGRRYNEFMRNVASYVHNHLTEGINVDQMAKDLYMSRSYLSTKFKQESGITLTNYIQTQKIKKAKDFLKNTDRSILEISTYLGFSSQGHFQNVFKKHTNTTPNEYRCQ